MWHLASREEGHRPIENGWMIFATVFIENNKHYSGKPATWSSGRVVQRAVSINGSSTLRVSHFTWYVTWAAAPVTTHRCILDHCILNCSISSSVLVNRFWSSRISHTGMSMKKSVWFCLILASWLLKDRRMADWDQSLGQRWNRVMGHRVSDFDRVGSCHGSVCQTRPVFDPVLSFNMRVYRGIVSTD